MSDVDVVRIVEISVSGSTNIISTRTCSDNMYVYQMTVHGTIYGMPFCAQKNVVMSG